MQSTVREFALIAELSLWPGQKSLKIQVLRGTHSGTLYIP